jgi:acyl carrier protein
LGGEILVEVQEMVLDVISRELPLSSGTLLLDTPLEEIGIDSLKAITILFELEDRLNIEIPDEIFDSLQDVNDIVQYLEKSISDR